jgi:2,3-bisphosphoglycerate-independent phosphoglycerate mutase
VFGGIELSNMKRPISLIILDGWGYRTETQDNAVLAAATPYFDELWNKYPHTLLAASGEAVGLPEGQVGNSEIGHTTIGAGTIIDTDLVRINKDVANGSFGSNDAFVRVFDHVIKHGSQLHVLGLLSEGGVHSHQEHLFALLRAAEKAGVPHTAIHVITDGRDTATDASYHSVQKLQELLKTETPHAHIASITGRYFAMDRDNNWDRVDQYFKLLVSNNSVSETTQGPAEIIKAFHEQGITDEFIEPTLLPPVEGYSSSFGLHDGVIFFNFRSDRARMLTEKILDQKFELDLCVATMTKYRSDFDTHVAYVEYVIQTTLAQEISSHKMKQVHIAETEKFPHATYFLNGGRETPHDGEEDILLPSRKDIPTHDLAPEMRALDIALKAQEVLEQGTDFLFVNIANPDMVGHTANVPAIVTAIETTDKALAIIVQATLAAGGIAIVTADHGNAETNRELDGSLHTSHTYNLVPCIVTDSETGLIEQGTLADLAPTVFEYLDITKPEVMLGNSLLQTKK